jgi:hypothetical protein
MDNGDTLSIKERWRRARLLRAQGSYQRALAESLVIVDAKDATWSSIALVEAIRICNGPLADPDQALALADRFLREWPSSSLATEVRQLRCHALGQLGRTDGCSTRPTARPPQ